MSARLSNFTICIINVCISSRRLTTFEWWCLFNEEIKSCQLANAGVMIWNWHNGVYVSMSLIIETLKRVTRGGAEFLGSLEHLGVTKWPSSPYHVFLWKKKKEYEFWVLTGINFSWAAIHLHRAVSLYKHHFIYYETQDITT